MGFSGITAAALCPWGSGLVILCSLGEYQRTGGNLTFILLPLVVPGCGEGLLCQHYGNQGPVLHGAGGGDWDLLKRRCDPHAPESDFTLLDHLVIGDPSVTVDKWGLMITPTLIS